jgi:predicted DNA-binding transcriptional regulator YafY
MPVNKKQLVRLVRLVAQLKENRYPNCASFAADMRKADIEENLNLSCTAKTIARDIQVLKRDFNAPIDFDPSRNGYYLTHHEWTFSCPQIFDDSCMLSAVLGARVAEHIFPQPMKKQIRDAVNFLLTNNNPDFLDTAQVDSLVVIPSNRTKIDAKVFMPLFYAWQNHEVCHIAYKDSKGKATERDFEPHALVFFDGVWYAKGFCHARKEMRTLAAARMKSVVPTGRHFEPDPKIVSTANEEGIFDREIVKDVVVHCDDYLAKIIQTRPLHIEQKVISTSDGGCDIIVEEMTKFRLITWVMHQCGRAILRQPLELCKEISDFANLISANHKGNDR